jgi:hypothetical protein
MRDEVTMPLPFHNEQTVGTCGLCEGPVVLPVVWWGVVPPVPTCKNCGATAKQDYGPKLPMNPPPKWSTSIEIDPEQIRASSTIEIDPDSHNWSGIRIDNGTECCVR